MARLVLARRTRSDLLSLDRPLIDAVEEALALLQGEPLAGYPLRGRLRRPYSLRIGSYRIIYQLADSDRTVQIAAIRHRSVTYHTDPL